MTEFILKMLNSRYSQLAFGIVFGIAYYVIILDFILKNTKQAGGLLGLYIMPAAVCGIALIFIKMIRRWRENEQNGNIVLFTVINIIISVIACLVAASDIIYGI